MRNGAAVFLATVSGATDAIGYLALGHVFTGAITGNLVLLGISLAHRNGQRIGRVLATFVCFVAGVALGARIARSPEPDDPVWPPAVTRAPAIEAVLLVAYAICRWTIGPDRGGVANVTLLGLGAVALDIPHHPLVLVGLVCGAMLAALLLLHAPTFAPAV